MIRLINFRKIKQRPLFFIIFTTFIAWMIMHLIFPDLFLYKKISFMRFAETEYNYVGVFTLLSQIYHGGIQLWNPYDQMPLAYYYLTGGLTYFSNLVTAIVYLIFSSLYNSPSIAYHQIFSVFYYLPTIFIINAGNFLLLRRFTKSTNILFIAMLLSSTFLIPYIYLGLYVGSLFSFFPLLIHFVLDFFETFRLKSLLFALFTFILSVSTNPLIGLGYFYLGIHLFLCVILSQYFIKNKFSVRPLLRAFNKNQLRTNLLFIIIISTTAFLLFLPWVYLLRTSYVDYDLAHQTSRFAHVQLFNLKSYLDRPSFFAPQNEFFLRMTKFDDNDFALSWVFIGTTAVFLSLCGIILSKNSQKNIFGGSIFLYWLLNSPRSFTSWQAPVHILNALTNPLNFIPRSFHMVGAYMMPFLLVPLICLGLIELTKKQSMLKTILVICIGILIMNPFIAGLSKNMRIYLILADSIWILILNIQTLKIIPANFTALAITAFITLELTLDGIGMNYYLHQVSQKLPLIPDISSKSSEVSYRDYQNPKELPFPKFTSTESHSKFAYYLTTNANNMQGLLYRYTEITKFLKPGTEYKPKHKTYISLTTDPQLQSYIRNNLQPFIFTKELNPINNLTNQVHMQIDKFLFDEVQFTIDVPTDGWLIFHSPFDKKWKAKIDGIETNLYPAQTIFTSVKAPTGQHQITFLYWPDTWVRYAIVVSLLLILFCPLVLIWLGLIYLYENTSRRSI